MKQISFTSKVTSWSDRLGAFSKNRSWSSDPARTKDVATGIRSRIFSGGVFAITGVSQLLGYNPKIVAQVFSRLGLATVILLIDGAKGQIKESARIQRRETRDKITVCGVVDQHRDFGLEREFLSQVISHLPESKQDLAKEIMEALPEPTYVSSYPVHRIISKTYR